MNRSKVVIRSVKDRSAEETVKEIFQILDWQALIPKGCKIVIKVNLSTPFQDMSGASNTSPELVEAVCKILRQRTNSIIIGESDGMRYKSEEAFEISGYQTILEKYEVKYLNFSRDEWVETDKPLLKGWRLPKTLLEADVFITLPVLKTHASTVFTGALKNQFGCYPQYNRILLHPHLDKVLVLINEILKPKMAIMDGIIAMEGRGPINGKPRRMDLILASRDPVALDSTAMRLVGIDPFKSGHVVLASKRGLGRIKEKEIEVDGRFEEYSTIFEPAERDLPIKLLALLSHSRFLTEKLVLNPEAFYPLRRVAVFWRHFRDRIAKRDVETESK